MKRTPLKRKTQLRRSGMGLPAPKKPKGPMGRCDELAKAIHKLTRPVCEVPDCTRSRANGDALHWAHIQPRTYHRTRHDEDNVLALCYGHHLSFTHRPIEFILFVGEDRWWALFRRAQPNGQKIDWRERERMLGERLAQLGGTGV